MSDAGEIVSGQTSVDELLQAVDLPNPATPVPFEKFAPLKESDDMLVRAAFWCFYSAWQADKLGKTVAATLAIEARHDGHTLRAITHQLHPRDAVIIQRRDLDLLKEQAADSLDRVSGVLVWLWMAVAFFSGIAATLAVWYFYGL